MRLSVDPRLLITSKGEDGEINAEANEIADPHRRYEARRALIEVGLVLFAITLLLNLVAGRFVVERCVASRHGLESIVEPEHDLGQWKFVDNPHAATRVIFMADGQLVEDAPPAEFFANPRSARAKDFLSKILTH